MKMNFKEPEKTHIYICSLRAACWLWDVSVAAYLLRYFPARVRQETADILKGSSCKWGPDMLHTVYGCIQCKKTGLVEWNLIGRNWPYTFFTAVSNCDIRRSTKQQPGCNLWNPAWFLWSQRGVTLSHVTEFFHAANSASIGVTQPKEASSCFFRIFPSLEELETAAGKPPHGSVRATTVTFPLHWLSPTRASLHLGPSHMAFIYTFRWWNSGRGRWPNTCSRDEGKPPFFQESKPNITRVGPRCSELEWMHGVAEITGACALQVHSRTQWSLFLLEQLRHFIVPSFDDGIEEL